jgi:hypothetical protein
VDFFRPGQLDWRTPNVNDLQLVAKVLKIFADSTDAGQQTKLLHGLFNLEEDLNGVAVETSMGLSRTDRDLLLTCHTLRLKGEKRARWLQGKGFEGFGKSALTKYRENPNSMRAQIIQAHFFSSRENLCAVSESNHETDRRPESPSIRKV